MQLSDFDFDLPEDLIATRPMTPRSAAKLLFAEGDAFHDKTVGDLLDLFQAGDRLVLNNTRVIPARLNGVRKRRGVQGGCLLYTSPSPRDLSTSRMPSSA